MKWNRHLRTATFVAILVFAYVLTFTAWRVVGLAAGLGDLGAVLLALIIDALTLQALVGLYDARSVADRAWSWAVLLVFGTISVGVNAIHARPVDGYGVDLDQWQVWTVAALPPLVLLVGAELWHRGRVKDKPPVVVDEVADVPEEVDSLVADEPEVRETEVSVDPGYIFTPPAPLHVVPKASPRRAPASEKAARLESARTWLAENPGGSDGQLAKHLGVGRTSAQRYREQLVRTG